MAQENHGPGEILTCGSKASLKQNNTTLEARCSPLLGQEEVNKAHGYSSHRKRTASSTSGITSDRKGQQLGLKKLKSLRKSEHEEKVERKGETEGEKGKQRN